MATIRDVAAEAGVSVQTVSNVLHGRSFVRPETQERVRKAIERLQYQPNQAAQSMRSRLSQTLGFLVSDPNPRGLADPFYGEVLSGITAATRAHGFGLLLEWLPTERPLQLSDFMRPFQTRRIDAAIVFMHGVASDQAHLLTELAHSGVLVAVLARAVPGEQVYSVLATDFEGTEAATQHLIDKDHRRIAFIGSEQRWPAVEERLRGYQAAMEHNGLDAQRAVWSSPDWTSDGGALAVTRMLAAQHQPLPTALVTSSDVLAVGAMQALKAAGLRIPGDVAVFGFDDFEFARYTDPPLSTVRLPAFAMGRHAAELLLGHLHQQPTAERQHALPTQLVLRESA
jgi:DNA-binding LacI/PurR family transcriptional regulator